MKSICDVALNIGDLRELAKRRLPKGMFEFMDRGSEDDIAIRNNIKAYENIKLKPRTLIDVSKRNISINIFGEQQNSPLIIGPTGVADLLWWKGESALARAASKANIPFTLATSSTTPMEQIIQQTSGRMWLQMYLWDQREFSLQIIKRAQNAGTRTLVLTVDTPVAPNREFNIRNGFTNPFRLTPKMTIDTLTHPRWLFGVMGRYMLNGGMPRYANYPPEMSGKITGKPIRAANSSTVCWEDVDKLRALWKGTFILKGILTAKDAKLAVHYGVDGIIVSNHGGRNLDATMAPIDALPEVLTATEGRLTVIVDSGIRRGTDVIKALACGAHAVMIGRAALYGLGAAGEAGVSRSLSILSDEIDRTLALVGKTNLQQLDPSIIHNKSIG